MSSDREIAALKRRLDRHINWGKAARQNAQLMLSDDPLERRAGEDWWRATFADPRVVASR